MVEFRQFVRPEIAASAIAHLSIVALVFLYTEAHPLGRVASEAVNVDIVTPDEIEKKPEPSPSPQQLPEDLRALTKAAEAPAQPPAAPTANSAPRRAGWPNRKEAAVLPQPQQAPAQPPPQAQQPSVQPQTQAVPPPNQAPASVPSPSIGYVPPEPDVTVKYHVTLGLPEALPQSVLSADTADEKRDGGDAAAKAEVSTDVISAFRGRIRECSKLPVSLSPSDDVMIKLRILMTRDGRLAAEPMVKEGTASSKAFDLRDGAVAALMACQPYAMLPAEKYNEWKVIDLTFTPRDFRS
jgi:hypothetical protein